MKNNLMGKRAALYTRVSTEDQATHGVSLEAQRERLIEYAHAHDMKIVGIYTDEGISARKKYTRRPALCSILEDIKAGKVDIILFIKLDRWFRNIADFYEIQTILDKYKIDWIATEEDYDTTTANGRLSLNVRLAIAQDEADRTSERIKFTFNNLVKQGRVITGSMPIGYVVDENSRPVIDSDGAEIVKAAFDKYLSSRSARATALYCNKMYGKSFNVTAIKKLLSNTWYIGKAYGVDNYCPRIIDDETFSLVQKILSVRATRYSEFHTDRIYYFSGLVFCECGHKMTVTTCTVSGSRKREYIYYRCWNHHNTGVCNNHKQINQDTIENWLLNNIELEIEKYNIQIKKDEERRKKKKIDVTKIMSKIEKLKDLYLNDLIPRDIYERDYTSLSAQLQEAYSPPSAPSKPIDPLLFADFRKVYPTLDPEARKAIWSKIIDKIIVSSSGDLTITFIQL